MCFGVKMSLVFGQVAKQREKTAAESFCCETVLQVLQLQQFFNESHGFQKYTKQGVGTWSLHTLRQMNWKTIHEMTVHLYDLLLSFCLRFISKVLCETPAILHYDGNKVLGHYKLYHDFLIWSRDFSARRISNTATTSLTCASPFRRGKAAISPT